MAPESRHQPAYRFAPAAPDEEFVYGASGPGWHAACDHDTALEAWLTFLHEQDVERVCSLLSGEQLATDEARYLDAFGEDAVLHVPLPPGQLVDPEPLRQDALPFVDAAVDDDVRVVVHGLTGVCRTGQVHAAWLVHRRDYDPESAVETVREQGRDPLVPASRGDVDEEDVYDLLATFE